MVTLTIHQGRRWLAGLCAVLAAGLAAAACGLTLSPLETADARQAPPAAAEATADAAPPAARPLADYQVVWQRNLLAPLFDPAPEAAARAAPPPKPPVTLLGTVVEPGHTYGMFRDKEGRTKFVRVGQSVDGVEVKAITADGATVLFAGREVTLKVEAKDGR